MVGTRINQYKWTGVYTKGSVIKQEDIQGDSTLHLDSHKDM